MNQLQIPMDITDGYSIIITEKVEKKNKFL